MLTQTLRTLERDGLIARTVTPSVPVRVDYELTGLGRTLLPVQRAIKVGPNLTSTRSERHVQPTLSRPARPSLFRRRRRG